MTDGDSMPSGEYIYRDITAEDAKEWQEFLKAYVESNGVVSNKEPPPILEKFRRMTEASKTRGAPKDGTYILRVVLSGSMPPFLT